MSVNGFDFDGTVHRYNYNSLDNIPPNIAPAYSASSTYAVGDYCTKDNVLYKCSTAISTAEAWNSAHWTQVQLATDVADLKDDLSALEPGAWSNEAKEALMTCIEHIGVWSDGNASQYITSLRDALGIGDAMEWNYPSNTTGIETGTAERISSSDTRVVINTAVTYRRVIGSIADSPKVMKKGDLTPLSIAPIQIPDGATGATVTFSASGTGNFTYLFIRLRKTDDYYTVITWTAEKASGERTAFAYSSELVLLMISSTGSISAINDAKIVFDKNA